MKNTLIALSLTFTALLSANAFADAGCVAWHVLHNQQAEICGSVTIPADAILDKWFECGSLRVGIIADMHHEPISLNFGIVTPNGGGVRGTLGQRLTLVDQRGNGASVYCSIDQ